MRTTSLWKTVVVALILTAAGASAQTPTPVKPMAADAHPTFAVATIKPHDPNSTLQGFNSEGDRMTMLNESVASVMEMAYSINPHQIVDAPDWFFHNRYDMEATIDTPGQPNLRQYQGMLQLLLADRFGLKFHSEKRELPVYAIRIAKGGPKLKSAANPDPNAADEEDKKDGTVQTITYTSSSMVNFVLMEQFYVDRPLIDQTGLTDRYDFTLRYTYDEARATDPNAPPGLFTAIKEQLGLRLDAVKTPIDVFAIDHVEPPSAN